MLFGISRFLKRYHLWISLSAICPLFVFPSIYILILLVRSHVTLIHIPFPQPSGIFFYVPTQSVRIIVYIDVVSSGLTPCCMYNSFVFRNSSKNGNYSRRFWRNFWPHLWLHQKDGLQAVQESFTVIIPLLRILQLVVIIKILTISFSLIIFVDVREHEKFRKIAISIYIIILFFFFFFFCFARNASLHTLPSVQGVFFHFRSRPSKIVFYTFPQPSEIFFYFPSQSVGIFVYIKYSIVPTILLKGHSTLLRYSELKPHQ